VDARLKASQARFQSPVDCSANLFCHKDAKITKNPLRVFVVKKFKREYMSYEKDTNHKDANDRDHKTGFVKHHQLTLREIDVLDLLIQGKSNAEIASSLSSTKKSIEHHLHNVFAKLGVRNRANAIVHAITSGFVAKN
jgi:DNA-binding NarL/FixJ family response regulator